MKTDSSTRTDRMMKHQFFRFGIVLSAVTLGAGLALGLAALLLDFDARPYVAFLPVLYAPVLAAGVAWLAWTTAAPGGPTGR